MSRRKISPYTPSRCGAWHVASIAYTPSNDSGSNPFMSMKSLCTDRHVCDRPACRVSALPRSTWYVLSVTPVTSAPVKTEMFRYGPPIPHPTSSTFSPGLTPRRPAR